MINFRSDDQSLLPAGYGSAKSTCIYVSDPPNSPKLVRIKETQISGTLRLGRKKKDILAISPFPGDSHVKAVHGGRHDATAYSSAGPVTSSPRSTAGAPPLSPPRRGREREREREMEEATDLDFSGSSTTTTTMEEEVVGGWKNDWSPLVDWEALSGLDDFRGLMESMMGAAGEHQNETPEDFMDDESYYWPIAPLFDGNNNIIDGTAAPGMLDAADAAGVVVAPESEKEEEEEEEEGKGLRVVHLLVAAAEAMAAAQPAAGDLARVILVRLKELASPAGPTNMERLAAHFADALHALLEESPAAAATQHHPVDAAAAFQLLQDMSPYVKLGHFTANQAILEAVAHDRRVHVVDYDIMEGVQWASLMQALASRKHGPPAPHLRITALARPGRRPPLCSSVHDTGRRLAAFAASLGLPFSFHHCRLDPDDNFRPSAVKLVKGEALVLNCMLHLPHSSHRSPESVAGFLAGGRTLGPKLVALVEEEAPAGAGFLARFLDSLHHYSALYDSLEAGFPMQGRARALVERVFLGPRIAATLAQSYRTRSGDQCWADWMAGSGFDPVRISYFNHCQAKLLLGLFNDGYRVEEMAPNKLVLGWKSRRLISASVWTAPASPASSQTTS
ncbi:hypothetical protein H6P81_011016 [Aristolochia fimbriata]|uniref:Nodulation signaling pathway 2-like protein n=1 Tax=Aristolochia fimbriata TaxID=158543 RepID=A0AAV7ETU6_ARIFI|nr:hypothetical protein H6P81_011016 [Aristolochia fimbriata]